MQYEVPADTVWRQVAIRVKQTGLDETLMARYGLTISGRTVAIDNWAAGSAIASLDAADGLSFPTSGPVFILPAGFTANSADANIVDNQLGTPQPVPSLSGAAIAILAMLLVASGSRSLMRGRSLKYRPTLAHHGQG